MFKPYETIPTEVRPRLNPVGQWLMDSADRIRKHGQTKHLLRSKDGGHCIIGALLHYGDVDEVDSNDKTYLKAFNVMNARTGYDILGFNNAPERTAEEVIAALESAALEQVAE